jgi:hypothetical protein
LINSSVGLVSPWDTHADLVIIMSLPFVPAEGFAPSNV